MAVQKMNIYADVDPENVKMSNSLLIGNESGLSERGLELESSNKYASLELPVCRDEKFLQVLVHFRIANPEDLFILTMKGFETNLCRELTAGTDKVTQYLKHCTTTPSQDLYLKLLSGLDVIKQKLCNNFDFKELFKRNVECYNNIRFEMEPCLGPQDWMEIRNSTEICNIMKSVLGCYYTRTFLNCGLVAAEVLNDLMRTIMSTVSDDYCLDIPQKNYVRDLRSSNSGPTTSSPQALLPVLLCLIVLAG